MDIFDVILLIVVGLLFWRLWGLLGIRNDEDNDSQRHGAYGLHHEAFRKNETSVKAANKKQPPEAANAEGAENDAPETVPPQGRGLAVFRQYRPDFDEAEFLDGARRAYELVLQAFAADDLSPVADFLAPDVQAGFSAAIDERRQNNRQLVTEIIRLDKPALEDALVENGMVKLAVRYRAELISYFLAAGEAAPEPRPNPSVSRDLWIFEQKLETKQNTSEAIWMLASTEAE